MAKLPSARDRAPKILAILVKQYPDADCELVYSSALELLVATILSAQCTDARVNITTPTLFKKYPTAKSYARADTTELEAMIRSTGFYKNKAKSIQNCCMQLDMEHGGEVPEDMGALVKLAGVGRKTANLVRAYAFGRPGIICDTHVLRVSKRLGLSKEKNPDKVEMELEVLVDENDWTSFSTLLMWHGRRCCAAKRPACDSCSIAKMCSESSLNAIAD
jgi:endonuclease III